MIMNTQRPQPQLPPPSGEWRQAHLGLDETHPKVAAMAMSAEKFIRSALRDLRGGKTWLIITGQTGCGKTHVAERLRYYWDANLIDAWSRGWVRGSHLPACSFLDWIRVASESDAAFEARMNDELFDARFAVIDDLGAESQKYKNGETAARLLRVLNIMDGRWLLVTMNVEPANWERAWGKRVADRLMSGARLSMFEVPSYRSAR